MLSPELNGRLGPLTTPADVLRFPLIDPGHPWWLAWFQTYQLPIEALEAQNTPSLGTQIFSASAALDGLGVAMLTPAYHRRSLRDGKLTQPFSATQERGWSYWLAYPESRRLAKDNNLRPLAS